MDPIDPTKGSEESGEGPGEGDLPVPPPEVPPVAEDGKAEGGGEAEVAPPEVPAEKAAGIVRQCMSSGAPAGTERGDMTYV
jgi:hypothetical protein